jgi:branched-chain amino acid transport system ATP-binding protein
MVVIEHDLPLVLGLADRVLVLAGGRVVAGGAPGEVREDPLALAALGMGPPPEPVGMLAAEATS